MGETGINLAEFVLKVDTTLFGAMVNDFDFSFNPPFAIEMEFRDENGDEFIPNDQINRLAAAYDPENAEYVFSVTHFIQSWVSSGVNIEKFIIRPQNPSITLNRAVIGGINHPELAPKLRITYTRQKQ